MPRREAVEFPHISFAVIIEEAMEARSRNWSLHQDPSPILEQSTLPIVNSPLFAIHCLQWVIPFVLKIIYSKYRSVLRFY